jgi:hypothetical protein
VDPVVFRRVSWSSPTPPVYGNCAQAQLPRSKFGGSLDADPQPIRGCRGLGIHGLAATSDVAGPNPIRPAKKINPGLTFSAAGAPLGADADARVVRCCRARVGSEGLKRRARNVTRLAEAASAVDLHVVDDPSPWTTDSTVLIRLTPMPRSTGSTPPPRRRRRSSPPTPRSPRSRRSRSTPAPSSTRSRRCDGTVEHQRAVDAPRRPHQGPAQPRSCHPSPSPRSSPPGYRSEGTAAPGPEVPPAAS